MYWWSTYLRLRVWYSDYISRRLCLTIDVLTVKMIVVEIHPSVVNSVYCVYRNFDYPLSHVYDFVSFRLWFLRLVSVMHRRFWCVSRHFDLAQVSCDLVSFIIRLKNPFLSYIWLCAHRIFNCFTDPIPVARFVGSLWLSNGYGKIGTYSRTGCMGFSYGNREFVIVSHVSPGSWQGFHVACPWLHRPVRLWQRDSTHAN